jgi:hypothetical protein
MLHGQACDSDDFWDQDVNAQWRKLQVINFSKECCPDATSRRKQLVVHLRRKRVREVGRRARVAALGDSTSNRFLISAPDQKLTLGGRPVLVRKAHVRRNPHVS